MNVVVVCVVVIATLQAGCLPTKAELESRLDLLENWHGEWPLTTWPPDAALDGATLRNTYGAGRIYHLTPLIRNKNAADGYALDNATVFVCFKQADGIVLHLLPPWQPDDHEQQTCAVGALRRPVIDSPSGINRIIDVTFSRAGRYQSRFVITGTIRGVAVRRDGSFWIDVSP